MPPLILPLGEGDDQAAVHAARDLLDGGNILGYPTDTFYALGADPWNNEAMAALYRLKTREPGKPVLLLVPDLSWAERLWGGLDGPLATLAATFWPGPLTIAAPPGPGAPLLAGNNLALRLPGSEKVRRMLVALGRPLTGTSANRAGHPPASTARQVAAAFPSGLPLVLDGGTTPGGAVSTLIEVHRRGWRLLRAGALPWEAVAAILGPPSGPGEGGLT